MNIQSKLGGFFASLGLACDIATGSLRLLRLYPVLIVPLFPVFLMVLGVEFGLLFVWNLFQALVLIFVVACVLMFSFIISSHMLRQIHEGQRPSLGEALTSARTVRMFPRAFLLSLIWYVLVLILVAIEMAIKSLLSRSDDGGENGEGIVGGIFGTAADALRMMGFMMIPIMMFEDVGLSEGFKRLKLTLKNSPIAALSGLALTKMATSLIFLVVWGIFQVVESVDAGRLLIGIALFAVLGMGWMLAMYLEQLFATGLYLYTTFPESPVVGILLQEHIGRELPTVPAPGAAGT